MIWGYFARRHISVSSYEFSRDQQGVYTYPAPSHTQLHTFLFSLFIKTSGNRRENQLVNSTNIPPWGPRPCPCRGPLGQAANSGIFRLSIPAKGSQIILRYVTQEPVMCMFGCPYMEM